VEASNGTKAFARSLLRRQTCGSRYIKLYFWMLFLACAWILYHVDLRPPVYNLCWVLIWTAQLYMCYKSNMLRI